MSHPLQEALRSRLTVGTVFATCGVAAFLWWLGLSPATIATTAVAGSVTSVTGVVADAYDLRNSVENGAVGAVAVVYGVATLAFGDQPVWFPVACLLVGGWFLLDAVQTVRHEGVTVPDDDRDGDAVYQSYVTRQAHEAIQDRARTRRELDDALDADDPYIDTAVTRLRERGVVVRRGSELCAAETDTGSSSRVRQWFRDAGTRIARPVTMEFGARGSGDR